MQNNTIVIGGGIHGLTTAIALADSKAKVTLLEKKQELFQGTSGSTHNRAHMGYHYPKSIETAYECSKGLEYFKNKYPNALFFPKKGYYIIAKEGSQTTKEEYIAFCKKIEIPCIIEWPSHDFLLRAPISAPFLVTEPIFNTKLLCELLEKEALQKGVLIKKGSQVIKSTLMDGIYNIKTQEGDKQASYKANSVMNTTYAYANNILKIFGLEEYMTKYRLQTTEVVVAKTEHDIPPLTIMDGNFISIMPYVGHENHVLIYDVTNSIIEEKIGYFFNDSKSFSSNWGKMIKKGEKYFPFMHKLKYVCSLRGGRPIPIDSKIQSRKTRLKRYESSPGFYSLLEGKFISAPLMAKELIKMLKEDGFLIK
jgi:hypothetical protein